MHSPVMIHWFRRDLRLADNTALQVAVESGAQVVPLFVFDPAILASPNTGAPRVAFLLRALEALDRSLRDRGSRLLIRHGRPVEVVPAVVRAFRAAGVTCNADYSPYARARDAAVSAALDVPVRRFDDAVLRAPGTVVKADGKPYTVFTPFKNQWRALPPPPMVGPSRYREGAFYRMVNGEDAPPIPALRDLGFGPTIDVPEASEAAARRRLERFASGPVYAYSTAHNFLTAEPFSADPPTGPSYLSPYLRMGVVSPRQAYWAGQAALDDAPDQAGRQSVTAWVDELIWREFYIHILYHFPHVARGNFRPEYDAVAWRDAPADLAAWEEGRTGYPIVDAAMRQLRAVGWMPNRARMIVASFLTKDLLIHWQAGERHFTRWLIDGDPAANNGGWQWAAGTGTDAQPYFRIFNPVSQSQTHDPRGEYIRHWVPELRDVTADAIHAPWESGARPAGYPPPMVDHAFARERTLAAFKAARGAR